MKIIEFKIKYRNDYIFNERGFCQNPEKIDITDGLSILIAKSGNGWHFGVSFGINKGKPCSITDSFDDKQIAFEYALNDAMNRLRVGLVFAKTWNDEIKYKKTRNLINRISKIKANALLVYDLKEFDNQNN